MGGRYYITGVQLGMLKSLNKDDEIDEILEEIEESQFMGDTENGWKNKENHR